MRVQALEPLRGMGAADAEVERGAAVAAGAARRELTAQRALIRGGALEAPSQLLVGLHLLTPTLDSSRGLETRHGGDEVPARQVVRGRERSAVGVIGLLLGHRG